MPVVILTVRRPVDYIEHTIQSLRETGYLTESGARVHIVVGNPDSSHLNKLLQTAQDINTTEMSTEEAAALGLDALGTKQKCTLGHYRWMKLMARKMSPDDMVLACEDDIIFARGWRRYLVHVLQDIWRKVGRQSIVSLYRLHQEGITKERAKERFAGGEHWYPVTEHFWGTQAIVYPVSLLEELADYLHEHGIRAFENPVDMLIGDFAWKRGVPLLASTPSLVEHIGAHTTGQSLYHHQAGFFLESVEPYA